MQQRSSRLSHVLSGLVGGLVAVAVGAVLLATGVVEAGGETDTVVTQQPVTQPAAEEGRGLTVGGIYERVRPGVVFVEAEGTASVSPFGFPEGRGGTATGSGFVLDREGFVLTNAHVVDRADEVTVTLEGEEQVPAEVVGVDLSSDLAVLKVDPSETGDLEPLPLGDSGAARVGDPTVAIGSPFGFESTVTTGIVSATERSIQAPNGFSIDNVIQTDASINPGNSGGPLLDAQGRVIGVNSQIATGGANGSVGIAFAVPIDTAKTVVPQLKEDGEVERAFLGVTTTDVTPTVAEDFNLPVEEGALVQDVTAGGPVDDAGIRAGRTKTTDGLVAGGDVIVGVDGEEVAESADVAAAIADDEPGETVEVEVYREDERQTFEVELGKRPEQASGLGVPPGGGGGPFPLP